MMTLKNFRDTHLQRRGIYLELERPGRGPAYVVAAKANNASLWVFFAWRSSRGPDTKTYHKHGPPLGAIFAYRYREAESLPELEALKKIKEDILASHEAGYFAIPKGSYFLEGGREMLCILECRMMEHKGEITPTDWSDDLMEEFALYQKINRKVEIPKE